MCANAANNRTLVTLRTPNAQPHTILPTPYPLNHKPYPTLEANHEQISHRCYLREIAFEWKLTKETIYLLMGCLQGG